MLMYANSIPIDKARRAGSSQNVCVLGKERLTAIVDLHNWWPMRMEAQ